MIYYVDRRKPHAVDQLSCDFPRTVKINTKRNEMMKSLRFVFIDIDCSS